MILSLINCAGQVFRLLEADILRVDRKAILREQEEEELHELEKVGSSRKQQKTGAAADAISR